MEYFEVGWRLRLQPEVWARFEELNLVVDVTAEIHNGRYVCTKLDVSTLTGGPPGISLEALRELKVAEMVEKAARQADIEAKISEYFQAAIEDPEAPDEQPLDYVAAAYRYGFAIGSRPTREVMRLLGLTRSSAARWIAAAREDGVLGETRERQAGGIVPLEESLKAEVESLRRRMARLESRIKSVEPADRPEIPDEYAIRRRHAIEIDRQRLAKLRSRLERLECQLSEDT